MLRIISGEFRGRKLKTIDAPGTRPMTDRVRESLFNILAPEIRDAVFLDLFAGSGAVGIEALSRGASRAVFVESDRRWSDVIGSNLRALGLEDRSEVLKMDAYEAVRRMEKKSLRFDVIFAGPPYGRGHHNRILASILDGGLSEAGGVIVVQYRAGDLLVEPAGCAVDTRTYGITSLSFIRKGD